MEYTFINALALKFYMAHNISYYSKTYGISIAREFEYNPDMINRIHWLKKWWTSFQKEPSEEIQRWINEAEEIMFMIEEKILLEI